MSTYTLRLVCEDDLEWSDGRPPGPHEEIVIVEADTPQGARNRAVRGMTLRLEGRTLRVYDVDSGAEIVGPPLGALRPGLFFVDGLEGTYQGFSRGEVWNGFAVPLFGLEEARRIAGDYADQEPTPDGRTESEYDAEREVIRLYDPSVEDWDEIGAVEVEGRPLYPIGTRIWTWSEAGPEHV